MSSERPVRQSLDITIRKIAQDVERHLSELLAAWRDASTEEQRLAVAEARRAMSSEAEQQVRKAVANAKDEWFQQHKLALEAEFDRRVQKAIERARVTWDGDRQRQLEAAVQNVQRESEDRVARLQAAATKADQEHRAALDDVRRAMAAEAVRRVHESVAQAKQAWESERQQHIQESELRLQQCQAETRAAERTLAEDSRRALEAEFDRLMQETLASARLTWEEEQRRSLESVMREAEQRIERSHAELVEAEHAHRAALAAAQQAFTAEAEQQLRETLGQARAAWDDERRDILTGAERALAEAARAAEEREAAARAAEQQVAEQARQALQTDLQTRFKESLDAQRAALEDEQRRSVQHVLDEADARVAHLRAEWRAADEQARTQAEQERQAALEHLRRTLMAEADQRLSVTLNQEKAAWADAQRQVVEAMGRDAEERLRQREPEIRAEEREQWEQARHAMESAFDVRLQETLEQQRHAWREEHEQILASTLDRLRGEAEHDRRLAIGEVRRAAEESFEQRLEQRQAESLAAWHEERRQLDEASQQLVQRAQDEARAAERAEAEDARRALEAELQQRHEETLGQARLAWLGERDQLLQAAREDADRRLVQAEEAFDHERDAARAASDQAREAAVAEVRRQAEDEWQRRLNDAVADVRAQWDAERHRLLEEAQQRLESEVWHAREVERATGDEARRVVEADLNARHSEALEQALDQARQAWSADREQALQAARQEAEARLADALASHHQALEAAGRSADEQREAALVELRTQLEGERDRERAQLHADFDDRFAQAEQDAGAADERAASLEAALREAEDARRRLETDLSERHREAFEHARQVWAAEHEQALQVARQEVEARLADALASHHQDLEAARRAADVQREAALAALRSQIDGQLDHERAHLSGEFNERLARAEQSVRDAEARAASLEAALREAEAARQATEADWSQRLDAAVAQTRLQVQGDYEHTLEQVRGESETRVAQLLNEQQQMVESLRQTAGADRDSALAQERRAFEESHRQALEAALARTRAEWEAERTELLDTAHLRFEALEHDIREAERAKAEEARRALEQQLSDRLHETLHQARTAWQTEHDAALQALRQENETALARTRTDGQAAIASAHHALATASASAADVDERLRQAVEQARRDWADEQDRAVEAVHRAADQRIASLESALREAEQSSSEVTRQALELEFERRLRETLERARMMWEDERQEAIEALMRDADARVANLQPLQTAVAPLDVAQGAGVATPATATAGADESTLATLEQVLESVERIDRCRSLRTTVDALAVGVGTLNTRAMVFLVRSGELCGWRFLGLHDSPEPTSVKLPLADAGVFATVISTGQAQAMSSDELAGSLAFARPAHARAAVAVPVVLADATVALVYTEGGGAHDRQATTGWAEIVQVLARHASRHLEALTAAQTAWLVGA